MITITSFNSSTSVITNNKHKIETSRQIMESGTDNNHNIKSTSRKQTEEIQASKARGDRILQNNNNKNSTTAFKKVTLLRHIDRTEILKKSWGFDHH